MDRRASDRTETVLPLVDESLSVGRRVVETGKVRIDIVNDRHDERIVEQLVRGGVEIERVAIGRRIDGVPPMREEGETIVIPIVEEVLVVEKRLMLVEEIRIHRSAMRVDHAETVGLIRQRAVIERLPGSGEPV